MSLTRPDPAEYDPYYAAYIERLPEEPILALLARQGEATVRLLRALPAAQGDFRYAPGKWSVKEVVGHVTDTERIFAYRALSFARGETQALPGYDQDAYVAVADFGRRPLADLVDEFEVVRRATLRLFHGLSDDAVLRSGTANGVVLSVRATAYIIAGHELHHTTILRERYLTPA